MTLLGTLSLSSLAAVRTWDGGGGNSLWLNATNWVGDVAPLAGDDLVFPGGVSQLTTADNFPSGTTFNSLTLGGAYSLSGASIGLNAGILATNGSSVFINNSLVLNSNQTFTLNVGTTSFYIPTAINLNGNNLTFSVGPSTLAQVQAAISGSGALIKSNTGSLLLYASNSFSGTLEIFGGTVSVYHSNALGTASAGTSISTGGTLVVASSTFTLAEPITLAGALNASSVTLTGPISLADPNALIQVTGSDTCYINSVISGPFGLTKGFFPGTLVLNSHNTYTGTTTISGGTLLVNGSQPASPMVLTGGNLGGTGTVGTINVNSSGTVTVAPGPASGPGILTCSNVTFSPFTFFSVDLNGTVPGTGYDQLNVHGSVTLSNAVLSLSSSSPILPPGTQYMIINNDGSDAVQGTFSGLPEGAVVTLGTNQLHISYSGGDGNDVVLTTPTGSQPGFSAISRPTDGQILLQATGAVSGVSYTIQAATNLAPSISWSNIGTALANGSGQFSFTDTNAPLFPMRFYRAATP